MDFTFDKVVGLNPVILLEKTSNQAWLYTYNITFVSITLISCYNFVA